MKDCLIAMAKYNRQANRAMCGIMKGADREKIAKDCGTFYHTAIAGLGHIASAEAIWLKRFASFGAYASLESGDTIAPDMDAIRARLAGGVDGSSALLDELDALLIDYIEELSEEELMKTVRYKNMKGDVFEKPNYQTILHVLTHSVHHRGEVSAMLDIQGIKNDYSGFVAYTY
jgi:uncharacterized damage-inducible protein DinB